VAKLHAHVYKGALLSVTLKKRLDTLSKPTTIPKTSKSKSLANNEVSAATPTADTKGKAPAVAAPSHASRLIVRNLPFNATEQDLRAIFLPYGPIHSVHIPLDDKPAPKVEDHAESSTTAATRRPRTRGFAFIWMLSRKDAERAIEGCNGMVVRAGTAETLVLDKQKRKKVKRLERKAAAAAAGVKEGGEEAGEDDVDEDEDVEKEEKEKDDKRATERVIAVDWALSKDKWKEEKAKIHEDEDVEMDSVPSDSEDDEDEDGLGVHSGSDDNDDDSDSQPDDEDDNDEEPVKPQLPPPETGTTLFIRNIPFNATEDELRTLCVVFPAGPI
jgi:nucleolar protein 4